MLFDSAIEHAGKDCVGAILTGMGVDSAAGLRRMRDARGHTLAQDEASSVEWGILGAAFKMGSAADVLPISKIGNALLNACKLQ